MTIQHLYPATRPSLDLNFAQTKRLDPRVTFTRGSTATYVGSDGLIKTAADNEARFDHDPVTGESLGLLVEESRTNLVTYSESMNTSFTTGTQAIWTTSAPSTISPDGSSTTTALNCLSGAASRSYRAFLTTFNAVPHTFSVWLKFSVPTFDNNITLRYADVSDAHMQAVTFSLSGNGSAGSGGKITPFSNGWYKCEFYFTPIAGSEHIGLWFGYNAANTGASVYAWGAQLEEASFPTSYIPTSGSTATRAAEVTTITGTNFSSWYNQSEGTMQMIFNASFLDTDTRFLSAGTTSVKGGYVYRASTLYAVQATGANNWSSTASWLTTGIAAGNNRFAFGYSPGSNATVRNGSIQETNTETVIVQETSTTLYIAEQLTGTIARLAYYPTRLTDAQLQALTL